MSKEWRTDMDKYEIYEKKCEEIRRTNAELLELFEKDLSGLSPKTINRHLANVDLYINDYLLRLDALTMEHGIEMIDDFLGYFFICKCMWSTPATIKSTAASIKKFYKCMMKHGKITGREYDALCDEIKTGMEFWQEDCAMYNDPDADDPFMMF